MRAAFYAACAIVGLMLEAGCAPKEIIPPPGPDMYAVEFRDGVRCIVFDDGTDDFEAICDFSRAQAESATEVLL